MKYSSVKIERLLAVPAKPRPNQFYMIEGMGTTALYLSDSNSNLILLSGGSGNTPAPISAPGAFYLFEDDHEENAWPIPGPPGATGSIGTSGRDGVSGPPGLDGAHGEDAPVIPGLKGDTGATGVAGSDGIHGAPGLDGSDAEDQWPIPGLKGDTGATGATGATGSAGATGSPGPPGLDGLDANETIFIGATSNLITEQSFSVTTGSLANAASETGTIQIARHFIVKKVITNQNSEIRLYGSSSARSADATRIFGDLSFIGTQSEYILGLLLNTSTGLTWFMSPPAVGENCDNPSSPAIYYRITNNSGSTNTVTVTFKVIILET